MFSVENVPGKVEQEERVKDIRLTKHRIVIIRI
jgi:hypothetical protein